jgi:hypothetical protein
LAARTCLSQRSAQFPQLWMKPQDRHHQSFKIVTKSCKSGSSGSSPESNKISRECCAARGSTGSSGSSTMTKNSLTKRSTFHSKARKMPGVRKSRATPEAWTWRCYHGVTTDISDSLDTSWPQNNIVLSLSAIHGHGGWIRAPYKSFTSSILPTPSERRTSPVAKLVW